jgi:predicted RNase H-like nuclease
MILAGIDLAWACTKNPTAIATGTYDGDILHVTHVNASVLAVDGIVEQLLDINGLTGVAIDASLIIPNVTGQRACERELSAHYGKMGASCHASNLTLYPAAASVALSRKLEEQGFTHLGTKKWQIECYPHPAIIEIFGLPERLKYKKGRITEKKAGQKQLASLISNLSNSPTLPLRLGSDVREIIDPANIDTLRGKALKSNEDMLDAIICLYVAGLYAIGTRHRVFGDTTAGYIWVPASEGIESFGSQPGDVGG